MRILATISWHHERTLIASENEAAFARSKRQAEAYRTSTVPRTSLRVTIHSERQSSKPSKGSTQVVSLHPRFFGQHGVAGDSWRGVDFLWTAPSAAIEPSDW